jgi:hypothetical protein
MYTTTDVVTSSGFSVVMSGNGSSQGGKRAVAGGKLNLSQEMETTLKRIQENNQSSHWKVEMSALNYLLS